jgi:hypothetical protein
VSHTLARPHSLRLIDLEHNLKFQEKPEYWVSQTGWSDFGRFNFNWRRMPVTEIGTTTTQAASRRGKARTATNLGASGGGD